MWTNLISAVLAAVASQDGTLAPDRETYTDLVRCAGVYRASVQELTSNTDAVPGEAEAAGSAATGFQHLAYLMATPLRIETAQTDAEITAATEAASRPYRTARTLERLRIAREGLETERAICTAVLQRISETS